METVKDDQNKIEDGEEPLPERIDVREIIAGNDRANTKVGITMLVVVPAILLVIGLVLQMRSHGSFPGWITFIIVVSMLIGGGILIAVFKNKRNPDKHSALDWPVIGPPDTVVQAIERAWASVPNDQKIKLKHDRYLAKDWIIDIDGNMFNAWPLREMIWVFYSIHKTRINGITTTSRDVWMRFKSASQHTGINVKNDEEAAKVIAILQQHAPWSFYGYSEGNKRGWNKEQERMIAAVRERYRSVMAGQQLAPPANPMESENQE